MADKAPNVGIKNMILQHLSIEIAKIIAFILVIIFIIYNSVNFENSATESCERLLTSGEYRGHESWQPTGCMMHKYTKKDAIDCFKDVEYWGGENHIVFLGDSRLRQLYFSLVNLISTEPVPPYKAHSDAVYTDKSSTKIVLSWRPFLNDSFIEAFQKYIQTPVGDQPRLIVTGIATWNIKFFNASKEGFKWYKGNLTRLVPYFKKLEDSVDILWMLQDPVDENKLDASRKMLTNQVIDEYNTAAIQTLYNTNTTLWSSSRLVAKGSKAGTTDGLHNNDKVAATDLNILLNWYCNKRMNHIDGTCCTEAEPVTSVQKDVAVVLALLFFLWVLTLIWKRPLKVTTLTPDVEDQTKSQGNESWKNLTTILSAIGRLTLIMAYFYLCDRTNLFEKENKHYTLLHFVVPLVLFVGVGFLFTKDSDQTAVLHRHQTDEWKGWMQIIILIYHYSGASKVIPIYMQIRCLVTSYLFLTGFGHFTFFYKKGDFSAFRFCQVMFRMNFLVIMLCLVMNRPYMFYYFVPLVSFFFLGIFATMAVWPHITAASADANKLHYGFLLMKLVLLLLVTYLFNSFVFFENIFMSTGLKPLFSRDDSVKEWFFRWSIDRFSVIYGMMFAFLLLMAKKHKLISESDGQLFLTPKITNIAAGSAILSFSAYTFYTSMCTSKPPCNYFHAYASFLPIVSFIVLRNLPFWLRKRYSTFFAWFGQISLELFIGQYHTWLAADTQGLLILVPGYPGINLAVTSFIFVCLAHEVHVVTGTLANFAVPKEGKYLARNCLIFVLVMIPIAINKGVFREIFSEK